MTNIYQTCYDLIAQYVYGSVAVGSYQELVCIAVSTIACLFVVSIPFVIVWNIVKMLTRW